MHVKRTSLRQFNMRQNSGKTLTCTQRLGDLGCQPAGPFISNDFDDCQLNKN
jgi:hypothetical protein